MWQVIALVHTIILRLGANVIAILFHVCVVGCQWPVAK
jgi:hypothetical protein